MCIVISSQAVQRGRLVMMVVGWYDGCAKLWGWKDNIKLMLSMAQCWRKTTHANNASTVMCGSTNTTKWSVVYKACLNTPALLGFAPLMVQVVKSPLLLCSQNSLPKNGWNSYLLNKKHSFDERKKFVKGISKIIKTGRVINLHISRIWHVGLKRKLRVLRLCLCVELTTERLRDAPMRCVDSWAECFHLKLGILCTHPRSVSFHPPDHLVFPQVNCLEFDWFKGLW